MTGDRATFQLRFDRQVAQKIKAESARQHVSVSRRVNDAIDLYLNTLTDREWRKGFEATAEDPSCTDVGWAFDAQSEIVLRNDLG